MVADLRPDTGKGLPADFMVSGGKLYFQAHTGLKNNNMLVLQLDASTKSVGHAYGSSIVTPTMTSTDPAFGSLLTMSGSGCEVGSQIAFVLLGSPIAELVYQSDLSLYVGSPSVLGAAIINDSWSLSLVVPPIPALAGISLAGQAIIAPTTAPMGLSATNGVHMTFGN